MDQRLRGEIPTDRRVLDPANSHDFMRDKLAWHEQVLTDPELPPLAKVVAGCILHDLNATTGDAWRGQTGIATMLGVTARGVQKALAALAAAGHIEIITAKGRGKTNRYRAVLKNTNGRSSFPPENTNTGASNGTENTNAGSEKHERGFVQTLEESLIPPLTPPTPGSAVIDFPRPATVRHPPPGEVREAVRHLIGEAAFASYVAPSAWRDGEPVIVCRWRIAADRLRELIGWRGLRDLGLTVVHDPDEHARLTANVVPLVRRA